MNPFLADTKKNINNPHKAYTRKFTNKRKTVNEPGHFLSTKSADFEGKI